MVRWLLCLSVILALALFDVRRCVPVEDIEAKYDRIHSGMTLDEVSGILGKKPDVLRMEGEDGKSRNSEWQFPDGSGFYAGFTDGRITLYDFDPASPLPTRLKDWCRSHGLQLPKSVRVARRKAIKSFSR
jgi:hypothetical protein